MKRRIAERLAELLADDRGAATLGLMRLMRLYGAQGRSGERTSPGPGAGTNDRVGIWEASSSGDFVRSPTAKDANLWADVDRLAAKGRAQRTVLVGESVARGYLYDPCWNPAIALQEILQRAADDPEMEVVDLARSDLLIDALQHVIRQSLVLQPDAIVVFAGNNWGAQIFEVLAPDISKMLGDGAGPAAIGELMARQMGALAESFVRWLGQFSASAGVPVTVLVPEFNLVDWRPAVLPSAPYLRGERNRPWIETRRLAEQSLEAGDHGQAARLAGALRDLDGGATMTAAWIEAEAMRHLNGAGDRRGALEAVRDAEIWRPTQPTPRCFGAIQSALRRSAEAAGLTLLDLPARFERYSGGLPDRRLFLDYCHLTSEGTKLAMASTAAQLLPMLGNRSKPDWRDLLDAATGPADEVEADARLMAAIHCAKLGQPVEFVQYQCAEAVTVAPRAADSLGYCLDFQSRRTPNLLCASFSRLLEESTPLVARYLLTHGAESKDAGKPLRRTFMKAALNVLEPTAPAVARRLPALLAEVHRVTATGLDLLQQAYAEEGLCAESQSADFFRSHQTESRFVFYCDEPTPLELEFVCRVPEAAGEVSVFVNGTAVGAFAARDRWGVHRLTVRAGHVAGGENRLDIHWPLPPATGESAFDRIQASIEAGSEPGMSPVFGELHGLVATAAGNR